jgi:hypothetical protein
MELDSLTSPKRSKAINFNRREVDEVLGPTLVVPDESKSSIDIVSHPGPGLVKIAASTTAACARLARADSIEVEMTIDERIEFLMQSIESHDRQIGELTDKVNKVTDAVATLVRVTNEDATAIRTLARIAEVHERRIAGLEGKS